jgi:hypothetical protein
MAQKGARTSLSLRMKTLEGWFESLPSTIEKRKIEKLAAERRKKK